MIPATQSPRPISYIPIGKTPVRTCKTPYTHEARVSALPEIAEANIEINVAETKRVIIRYKNPKSAIIDTNRGRVIGRVSIAITQKRTEPLPILFLFSSYILSMSISSSTLPASSSSAGAAGILSFENALRSGAK